MTPHHIALLARLAQEGRILSRTPTGMERVRMKGLRNRGFAFSPAKASFWLPTRAGLAWLEQAA